ncbi:MAG: cob(I)yrinic acid a,c-diamide adenosyltransferase [Candidatus Neomarinimicrobiota bacterium]|nr:cob(I)yrinic acid a,c-diamide adenosyltransferase [Candidatus Neomarinimicrobiota bacterium]
MRITKVTTKTGDKGKTALGDGSRVKKDSLRIHCLGSIDELNSSIGLASVMLPVKPIIDLKSIQNDLLNIGAEISMPDAKKKFLNKDRILFLEKEIESINKDLPPLEEFILPGGNDLCSRIHMARSICRRAERDLVSLNSKEQISPEVLKYINRLSDYLFVVARLLIQISDSDEIQWNRG